MTSKEAFQKWERELSILCDKQLSLRERHIAVSAWNAAIRYANNETYEIMIETLTIPERK